MQELLLLTGNVEKPQDDNNVKFITSTVTYTTLDYDPALFVTATITYAVQEE